LNILSIHSFSFSLFLFVFSFSWSGVARLKGLMVQGKGLVSRPCPAHSAILTAHSTNIFPFRFRNRSHTKRWFGDFLRNFFVVLCVSDYSRCCSLWIFEIVRATLSFLGRVRSHSLWVFIFRSSAEPFWHFVHVESLLLWRGACWISQGDLVIMRVKRDKEFRKCFTKTPQKIF
jgi:hypothetical protein